jgi:hypothetical protein
VAILAPLAYATIRYREALLGFYFLDDFWVMKDAAAMDLDAPADVIEFFRPGHAGFLLYRPLTTVVYSYVLQALFGFDASGHHAFQLLVFAGNVALASVIVGRLTRSRRAAAAAGFLYAMAPGQAVNAYWLSAFTVTGTAFVLLLAICVWLFRRGAARALGCAFLQVVGLLCSEHAAVAPALLLIAGRLSPLGVAWRQDLRALLPSAALAGAYLAAKAWYFSFNRSFGSAYTPTLDPTTWVQHCGQYFVASWNVLTLLAPGPDASPWIGWFLAALFAVAAHRGAAGDGRWTLVAGGLALFAASLLPVVVLRTHYKDHYIAVAVTGAILALFGIFQLLTRRWQWLAIGLAAGVVLLDVSTDGRAWRENETLRLVVNGSRHSATWVQTVERVAAERGPDAVVFVPRYPATATIFLTGRAHTYFPSLPPNLVVFNPRRPPAPARRRVVLTVNDARGQPIEPYPGWNARWEWLRQLAR